MTEILVQEGPSDHIFVICPECMFGYCKTHEQKLHDDHHIKKLETQEIERVNSELRTMQKDLAKKGIKMEKVECPK
jgi:IS1 family transposase